ncbi:MAG: YdeI/OmpD-associated family protein [Gemmatimonadaceae bacterium]|nr:YdeI/OmpD-associated family protein [Gemmatimonadaceae bacterium]
MPRTDPRVTAYIKKQQPFAQPILRYLREVVHEAVPECEETLKWGAPAYMHHGIVCITAGFKKHTAIVLWKGPLILNTKGKRADEAWGDYGRVTTIDDLPARSTLIKYLRAAAKLNEDGVKIPARKKPVKGRPVEVPEVLAKALKKNKKARETFEAFSPSHRREYTEWISEAKRDETREKRLANTIEWLEQGKPRQWKYVERK